MQIGKTRYDDVRNVDVTDLTNTVSVIQNNLL